MLLLLTVLVSWVLLLEDSLLGWPWLDCDLAVMKRQDVRVKDERW